MLKTHSIHTNGLNLVSTFNCLIASSSFSIESDNGSHSLLTSPQMVLNRSSASVPLKVHASPSISMITCIKMSSNTRVELDTGATVVSKLPDVMEVGDESLESESDKEEVVYSVTTVHIHNYWIYKPISFVLTGILLWQCL